MYSTMVQTGDAKWLYFGSHDGVVVTYPGFVWADPGAANKCDEDYDSRLRSWQMIAATGPKNLVLVLDISGSMTTLDRMGGMKRAAKKVIDSATHVDYIGIITFNDKASTYQDLTTLARASPQFRTRLKAFVDSLVPSGASNFIAGYEAAFSLVDSSRAKNYTTGCHTTYVIGD
mmetsp:Transcript_19097/g.30868  ORF Transcript_19097/g.30868 Transcript_19097/m.30868 type:complete len:174 (-) Transcript_19097:3-524(-)